MSASALGRDRALVLLGLGALVALAWLHITRLAAGMSAMDPAMAMPSMRSWSAMDVTLLWLMWVVMMVAMMLPSAAPMILLFAGVQRRRREGSRPYVATGTFLAGYLVVWAAFSVAATALQWGLHRASSSSSMMAGVSPILGGCLLMAAGVFQWTPLKRACLASCRSPMAFITSRWREGAGGALRMGLEHGAFCVGCCWLLMGLLFVAGVMNLLWVAALAALVLVEKASPWGGRVSRVAGIVLVIWGGALLLGAG